MQIENHKDEVPFSHYEDQFRALQPEEAAARMGAKWDGKEFYVNLLGREFAISHPEYTIRALDNGPVPPLPTQTFLLRYLLESKRVAWNGTWKTFREMPWGEMYIKPYTGRVVRTPEGNVQLDFSGKLGGRGAYICPKAECLKKAQKSKALERSLEVAIPEEIYDRLAREIEVANHG